MPERAEQLTAEQVEGMTPEEIAEAYDAGQLDEYLATKKEASANTTGKSAGGADQGARGPRPGSPTEGMTPEEIAKATAEGQLDDYLSEPNPSRRRSKT